MLKCITNSKKLWLIGDVGGTYTRLSLLEKSGFHLFNKTYLNKNYNYEYGLVNIICKFISEFKILKNISFTIKKCCLAVPGINKKTYIYITNRPNWGKIYIDIIENTLSKLLNNTIKINIINDFEAQSYGILELCYNNTIFINSSKKNIKPYAVKCVIGAGTGLGQSFLTYCTNKYIVNPSEGGHIDFSPTNKEQWDLVSFLKKYLSYTRISNEDIISGKGISNIYSFLYYKQFQVLIVTNNLIKEISDNANKDLELNKETIYTKTLDLWCSCYGSIVADLSITLIPYGGIYIVGGIAIKNKEWFIGKKKNIFLDSFYNKGFLREYLIKIPIIFITNHNLIDNLGKNGIVYYLKNKR